MNLVYDSNALIAYLEDEPGAAVVEEWLSDPGNDGFVHTINLCEVFYHVRRQHGEDAALEAYAAIQGLGLTVREDMDEEFWQNAARIKADYRRVSLADCLCITLANMIDAEIITSDRHEIEVLVEAGICKTRFIPR